MGETARVGARVDKALKEYRFNEAALALYAHTWGVVCDWYVEFAKPLFQSDDAAVVEETRATMAWAIDQCLILLHPIMPYITEKLWRVSEFDTATEAPKGSVTLPVQGGAFCLPLADVVDVSAEKARLEKVLGKLSKEAGGLKGKLNNEKFLANAPEDVVLDQKARLEVAETELAKINAALERVAGLE